MKNSGRGSVVFTCCHADCMTIAVPLRQAMLVFEICHELGHIPASHHKAGFQPSQDTEQEADQIATEFYMKTVQAGLDDLSTRPAELSGDSPASPGERSGA